VLTYSFVFNHATKLGLKKGSGLPRFLYPDKKFVLMAFLCVDIFFSFSVLTGLFLAINILRRENMPFSFVGVTPISHPDFKKGLVWPEKKNPNTDLCLGFIEWGPGLPKYALWNQSLSELKQHLPGNL
jgi:hypothetical protein